MHLIALAAENHRLHHLYGVVKVLPYFADRPEPIPLSEVWLYDYNLLTADEKRNADITHAEVHEENAATARVYDRFYSA